MVGVDRGLSTSCVRGGTTMNPSITGDEFFRLVEFHWEKEVGQNAGAVWGNPGVNQLPPNRVYNLNSLLSSEEFLLVLLLIVCLTPTLVFSSLDFRSSGAHFLPSLRKFCSGSYLWACPAKLIWNLEIRMPLSAFLLSIKEGSRCMLS